MSVISTKLPRLPASKIVANRVDFVERRLESIAAVRGYGFTHDCASISAGPNLSAYKTLDTMIDKMNGQLDLGHRLRAVDVRKVASSVIRSHFLPDLEAISMLLLDKRFGV